MGFYTNYDPECLRAYADAAAENFDWMVNVLGGDPELDLPHQDRRLAHALPL